jgi:hypothetical protein
MSQNAAGSKIEQVMRDLEGQARSERRARILARGGPADYRDPALFAGVEGVFRRAIEAADLDALLLPECLDDPEDYMLSLRLRHASHRPIIGPLLVFIQRRLLLPPMRWLYAYSLENFRRQQRVNRLLFACVEELAIENARLRKFAGLSSHVGAEAEGRKDTTS